MPTDSESIDQEKLKILRHCLGLDQYGQGTESRNRYVTNRGSQSGRICGRLVAAGLMRRLGELPVTGSTMYALTAAGLHAVEMFSPKPPETDG